jgi:hypothetical protein
MGEFVRRVFTAAGAAVCIAGAAAFWSLEAATTAGPVWPLPALALLDWGVLGFAGFLAAGPGTPPAADGSRQRQWLIGGALLPLGAVGALSIGPFVFLAALLFLASPGWEALAHSRIGIRDLLWLAGGMVGNLVLLLLFIALG